MRTPSALDRDHRRRAVVIAIVALVVVSLAGPASAQSAPNATPVDSCTTIDTPGEYVLTGDINETVGEEEACIEITTSDVVFDGGGHDLAGGGSGHGVEVEANSDSVSNVTVESVHAHGWTVGVFARRATDGIIRNTVVNDTISGVALAASTGYRIADNTAYDNAIGLAVGGDSHNNTVSRETAVENKWGIHFERESGDNRVRYSVARNNSRWDYYSTRNDAPNTVSDLELPTATVAFTERNVALREASSPPPLPSDTGTLDSYLEATDTAGGMASLSLTMEYDSSDDASASLWRTTGGGWSPVSGAETNPAANTVSADNLTQFGTFGALADAGSGGPATVTTSQPPSVDRTLTTTRPTTARPTSATASTSEPETSGSTPAATVDPAPSSGSTVTTPSPPATSSANGTEPTATGAVGAESDTGGLLAEIGGTRLLFGSLGVVALVGLGLIVFQRRRGPKGPGGI